MIIMFYEKYKVLRKTKVIQKTKTPKIK